MTIAVRPAQDGDADRVAALLNAINSLDGAAPPMPMTPGIVRRDLLGPAPRAILLLGTLDDPEGERVIGFATAAPIYDASRCAGILMLLDLYVEPHARRRGVARALMAALAAEALRRDAPAIWWGVDVGDDDAMRFYAAIGAAVEEHFTGLILERPALHALADRPREGDGP